MGKIFIISDTHFGDSGSIIKYEGRPFADGNEMDEAMIENWNREVGPEDTVYHLGDLACGRSAEEIKALVGRLNGHKILVMGNHDQGMTVRQWMDAGFEAAYPLPVILDEFYILSHEPLYVSRAAPYANIFGHVHGNPAYRDCSARSFCACVERTGYKPVAFEEIQRAIREADGAETVAVPN